MNSSNYENHNICPRCSKRSLPPFDSPTINAVCCRNCELVVNIDGSYLVNSWIEHVDSVTSNKLDNIHGIQAETIVDSIAEDYGGISREHYKPTVVQNEIYTINGQRTSKIDCSGIILIPYIALVRECAIYREGVIKYGREAWKEGINNPEFQTERLEHAIRHLFLYASGDRTEDHLAKVRWYTGVQIWWDANRKK